MAAGYLLATPEFTLANRPDRLIMVVDGLQPNDARRLANQAIREARRKMPKLTGASSNRISPVYGWNYFGIAWQDSYVWFQEHGVRPFTMRSLAGKTIPMWIDDPTGVERQKNPKARTRTTLSGKTQVLIFRKAAPIGQRKTTRKRVAGQWVETSVPASYPGAPGRISQRESGAPFTTAGRVAGAVARGNVGVRWRYPGTQPRQFLNNAMTLTAQWSAILPVRIYVCDAGFKAHFKQAGRGRIKEADAPEKTPQRGG